MQAVNDAIFLPLLLQVLLTLGMFIYLGVAKSRAVKAGAVDLDRRTLHADAWPDYVQQINNNIRNQFEVPVLFYTLVLILYAIDAAGLMAQVMAWLFVLSRYVHAYIHTGSNYVPYRRAVFMFGCLVLVAMLSLAAYAVIT